MTTHQEKWIRSRESWRLCSAFVHQMFCFVFGWKT